MEPFITLVVVTAAAFALGRSRHHSPRTAWPLALRAGVTAMFLLTSTAHFVGMREELIAMVPDNLPAPGLLVTVTGLLELAGAIGLWLPRLRRWAVGGLTLLLVAMFPANVHHALSAQSLGFGEQLLPRTLLQLAVIAALVALFVAERPARRPAQAGPSEQPDDQLEAARSAARASR